MSPNRNSKNRSKNISVFSEKYSEYGGGNLDKSVEGKSLYVANLSKKKEEVSMPIRQEKPFKPIPKFSPKEIIIKVVRDRSLSEKSTSTKRKISVTKASSRVGPALNALNVDKNEVQKYPSPINSRN